jgi:HEAT repeat protein
MESVFSAIQQSGPAGLLLRAILGSLLGIFLLIGFIILRRWYRARYFRRRNARTVALRARWDDIVSGEFPVKDWRFDPLDSEIVESILLDNIEMATSENLPPLLERLRASGLLDARIYEARTARTWKQRSALLALGRTRAIEAIPALAAGLDSATEETRIAAVRGLGRTGIAEGAIPILDRIVDGQLDAPERSLKNSLANCCRSHPEILITYLEQSHGQVRELLTRVLSELASPELGEELLVLAADPSAEVRASAARALGSTNNSYTLPALHSLANDPEWFVRLRAVVALGQVENVGKIKILLRSLCDMNRHVRQRAAWALARMEPQLEQILDDVIATHDDYALQALISELERSGAIEKIIGIIGQSGQVGRASVRDVVEGARHRVEQSGKAVAAAAGAR